MSQTARPRSKRAGRSGARTARGGRSGTRIKGKKKSNNSSGKGADWAKRRFEETIAPFLSNQGDGMDVFRVYRAREVLPARPGPAAHATINMNAIKKVSPMISFGKAHREASKLMYMSPHHQSDLLCTASPGPKYRPRGWPDRKKAPAWFWASVSENAQRRERQEQLKSYDASADVGPGAYDLDLTAVDRVHRRAPKYSFGPKREDFLKDLSRRQRAAAKKEGQARALALTMPKEKRRYSEEFRRTKPLSPRYSFGAPRVGENLLTKWKAADQPKCSSFLNPSNTPGPTAYEPQYPTVERSPESKKMRFTSAKRGREDVFISKEHCKVNYGVHSPGPVVYASHKHDMGYISGHKQSTRLKWVP